MYYEQEHQPKPQLEIIRASDITPKEMSTLKTLALDGVSSRVKIGKL